MKTLSQCTILVVDDEGTNVDILVDVLGDDYDVAVAMDGESALAAVAEQRPDLILLDVMMPGMDGYEVCRRLKCDERNRYIPVIFVTALSQVEDETRGLELGAVDYITKPISPPIVRARVRNHLELKLAYEKLEARNDELVEAARLKEDVDTIMRHDLKTPLVGIIGIPQSMVPDENLTPKQIESLKAIETAGRRLRNLISLSLDLFRMERGTYHLEAVRVDVLQIIRMIVSELAEPARSKNLRIALLVADRSAAASDEFAVAGDETLCYSLFANLIKNAVEASPANETITIALQDGVVPAVSIHNRGAVPAEIRGAFFQKYATAGKRGGTGLGTYSARLMAVTQGGSVELATSEAEGTTITVRLPPADTVASPPRALAGTPGDDTAHIDNVQSELSALPPLRLLLVDDDENSRAVMLQYLRGLPFQTDVAADGRAGVDRFHEQPYDIVISDMEMPFLDGIEVTRKIRGMQGSAEAGEEPLTARTAATAPDGAGESRGIRGSGPLRSRSIVFLLSGREDEGTRTACLEAGADQYLVKPVEKQELLEALAKALRPGDGQQTGADRSAAYTVTIDPDLRDLIPSFLENKRRDIAAMQRLAESSDFEALRATAHRLKGTCRMYGLRHLGEIAEALEAAGREKNADASASRIAELRDCLANVVVHYKDDHTR